MHTLLDLRGSIPSFNVSDGKFHDVCCTAPEALTWPPLIGL